MTLIYHVRPQDQWCDSREGTQPFVSKADYDALAAELAETQRQLKNVAPVGRYNGRNIEEWAKYGAKLEAALRDARYLLGLTVTLDDPDNVDIDTFFDQVTERIDALLPENDSLKCSALETEGKLVVSPTVKRIAEEAGYTDLIENKLIPETSAEPNVCPTCRGRGANTVDKASGKTVYYCNCETVVKRAASTQGHMHAEWAPQSDCLCEACVEYFQSDRGGGK